MTNRIMNFIDKSNKLLLFVAAIIVIITVGKDLIRDIFRKSYTPPIVQVVKSDSINHKAQEIKLKKSYVGFIKDVHILELTSNKIIKTQSFSATADMMIAASSLTLGLSSNAVNLMFTKAGTESKLLFKHNTLIIDFSPAQFSAKKHQHELTKNIYMAVKTDTNNDGILDSEDTKELLVSEYNGENLSLVMSDIKSFEIIDDDLLLINKGDEENSSFYIYNVLSSKVSELDTEL